jgi:hypothetical protein
LKTTADARKLRRTRRWHARLLTGRRHQGAIAPHDLAAEGLTSINFPPPVGR